MQFRDDEKVESEGHNHLSREWTCTILWGKLHPQKQSSKGRMKTQKNCGMCENV